GIRQHIQKLQRKEDPADHTQKLQRKEDLVDEVVDDLGDSTEAKPEPLSSELSSELSSQFLLDRYSSEVFQGILPDTGAAGHSTAGYPQVVALRRIQPVKINKPKDEVTVTFGGGQPIESSGTITVDTPLGSIDFHVVPVNTPFLLCLRDMDRLRIQFDNLKDVLRQGNVTVPIVRKWGHPWMLLSPPEKSIIAGNHMTDVELRRLHRRFGHPSVYRLHKLLSEAGQEVHLDAIQRLTKYCQHCQLHSQSPHRFRFAIKDVEDYAFNHEIIVDVMYLEGNRPVLHVVDSATAFNAARFLKDISAKTTWEALRLCWIDVYQGPPDWIVADAGRNFTAAEFRHEAKAMSIDVKIIPIESHHSVGKVERYHAAVRRAYEIIREECPSLPRDSALQGAIKSVNDTAGPDGLVPTLLVFGAYPRMTDDSPPSPDITQRVEAIRKASEAVRKIHARRQVNDALATRNGPDTSTVKNLAIGSQVRVWRERKGWMGPYRLIDVSNETCVIDINGPREFRSTVVKPFHKEDSSDNEVKVDETNQVTEKDLRDIERSRVVVEIPQHDRDPDRTPSTFMTTKEATDYDLAVKLRKTGIITEPGDPFEESTRKEVDNLIDRGVFDFIPFDPAKHMGIRIFKSKIIHEVKDKTTDKAYEKSRLVIQGYADDGKWAILTQSPTIQRSSQRLLIALLATLYKIPGFVAWLRDITQAYTQSASKLNRVILAQLPRELRDRYPKGTIIRLMKPLYGVAEAGTHWWAGYFNHHRESLEMETTAYDPCLLLTTAESPYFGIVGMQTDDTFGISDAAFDDLEESKLTEANLLAKPKAYLTPGNALMFNGGIVSVDENGRVSLRQKGQGLKLQIVDPKSPTAVTDYVRERARGAYIASICQPEASFDYSTAAQHQTPGPAEIEALNRRVKWQKESIDRGLDCIPLDLATMKIFVFVDGSFANNTDLSSQIGYVILLANEKVDDEEGTFEIDGNVVHYSSTKSKRVTRSVLASEVYGMVAGADLAVAISTTVSMITRKLQMPSPATIMCTDSYSLY
ncbi:hypothetical protein CSHISOI_11408, partial [Colletotrichum shisoi]